LGVLPRQAVPITRWPPEYGARELSLTTVVNNRTGAGRIAHHRLSRSSSNTAAGGLPYADWGLRRDGPHLCFSTTAEIGNTFSRLFRRYVRNRPPFAPDALSAQAGNGARFAEYMISAAPNAGPIAMPRRGKHQTLADQRAGDTERECPPMNPKPVPPRFVPR